MKLIAFEVEDWEAKALEAMGDAHEVHAELEPLRADNAGKYQDAQAVTTFIESQLDRQTLEKLPELQLIATRSTGFDHIDTEYCKRRGIVVSNVPTYGKNTVAEHAFALLLAVGRNIVEAVDRTRRGDFDFRGLQGFDLAAKTLGVIGTGDIGLHAARIGLGFQMNVLAFDVKRNEAAAREMGFAYIDSLEDLLSQSDVVTIHVPANPKTRGMFGHKQFDRMKSSGILINTSRGGIVEMEALVRALAEGKIAGAGLDVLPMEPVIREEAQLLRSVYREKHDLQKLLADRVITNLRNVVVTPHIGFNTREAVERILQTTIQNIHSFAAGEPKNVVADTAPPEAKAQS